MRAGASWRAATDEDDEVKLELNGLGPRTLPRPRSPPRSLATSASQPVCSLLLLGAHIHQGCCPPRCPLSRPPSPRPPSSRRSRQLVMARQPAFLVEDRHCRGTASTWVVVTQGGDRQPRRSAPTQPPEPLSPLRLAPACLGAPRLASASRSCIRHGHQDALGRRAGPPRAHHPRRRARRRTPSLVARRRRSLSPAPLLGVPHLPRPATCRAAAAVAVGSCARRRRPRSARARGSCSARPGTAGARHEPVGIASRLGRGAPRRGHRALAGAEILRARR